MHAYAYKQTCMHTCMHTYTEAAANPLLLRRLCLSVHYLIHKHVDKCGYQCVCVCTHRALRTLCCYDNTLTSLPKSIGHMESLTQIRSGVYSHFLN